MRIRTAVLLIPLVLAWFSSSGVASPATWEKALSQGRMATVFSPSTPVVGTVQERAETEECLTCHEQELTLFNRTYHATVEGSCYACHQGTAATEHLQKQLDGEDFPGPALGSLPAEEANAVCLSCHERSHHAAWEGSAHERRGVQCIDCHAVHTFESDRKQLKTAQASETCYQCHQSIRAMSLRTSHHPVREGLMGCESCHDPHDGSRPKMIKADWTNELCLQCHTEKRGPFLWEHAPVRENCLNCHNPHGSNHDKLLQAKLPYLCQRCHLNTRHPGTFYDGSNAGTTIAAASNRAIEHACKNCHQNIHGSNSPSGPYLGR
ncbi:MAG TPA: DmsE family decaheme c-type cytochrome [Vicinamibacteria bacterium]|nr:DmsE family decaheme c-type cytochrome [Vicinamibacteria bacterium]